MDISGRPQGLVNFKYEIVKCISLSGHQVDMLCYALGRAGRLDLVEDMRDREQDFKEDRAQYLRGE